MKLHEYLSRLDEKYIEIIGNSLEVIDGYDMKEIFSKAYMIKLIVRDRLLNVNYLYKLLDNQLKVKFDSEVLENIKRITFGVNPKNEKNIKQLKECGLIFDKNIIPEDLRILLIDKYRKELIANPENLVLYNKHTPFLKLILFTSKIYHDGNIPKNTGEIYKYKHIKLIISYLLSKNLIAYVENKYITLNIDNYDKWLKGEKEIIKEFYNYVFENSNKLKVKELLYKLMSIQVNPEEWMDVKKIQWLLKEYEEEYDYALDIGLVIKAEDNREYIQFNNEVWRIFHKDIFDEFNNSELIITPDSEVFISYKDDPLLILMLSQFGKFKNEIGNNDYFLIFDISKKSIKNSDIGDYRYKDFIQYLKTSSNDLPDLVNEELMGASK